MAWTEFGYTGTSNSNLANTNYGKFTAASSGTVTKAGWKVKTVGDKCKIAITDGSSWLSSTEEVTSTVDGWNDVTFSSPATVVSGQDYYVAFMPNLASTMIYMGNHTPQFYYNNNSNYQSPGGYSSAFDVGTQGTPIIKAQQGVDAQAARYEITAGPAPSGSTVTIPPPIAMVAI